MIVFSATHQPSGRVFVGSCRVELDFHWAMLVTQADEDVPGALFDYLRADGVAAFDVSEYAQAESARELAELCREAVEELGGELIKAVRKEHKPAPVAKKAAPVDEELVLDDQDAGDEDDVEGWLADRRKAREKQASVAAAAPAVAAEPAVRAPSRSVAVEKPTLRDSRSTSEASEMKALMAAVEARRLSQRKSKPAAKRAGASKSASSALARSAKSAGTAKPESAAARERRIKAALAEQKKARLAAQEAKVAEQADEMAAILNRLDERSKAAERYRRRR